jgi:origin recognition complex subunit 5
MPSPRLLQSPGIPHLHFPPYSRDESIKILSLDPPVIFIKAVDESYDYGEEEALEDRRYLWPKYCRAVWDAVAHSAARDLASFRTLCYKLWRPFVQPICDGQFGTQDFNKLLVNRRPIFQREEALSGSLMSTQETVKKTGKLNYPFHHSLTRTGAHELPYFAKYLLCAAYLASFNPARQDPIYFMKSSEKRRKKRAAGIMPGRRAKVRKVIHP